MSVWLAVGLFAAQGALMLIDELYFHRRRGLSRWERVGHPLDTLTVLACYAIALAATPTETALGLYAAAATFSCLFVTKDQVVHARSCAAGEHWLHAVLFMMHPVVLATVAFLWLQGGRAGVLMVLAGAILAFAVYQTLYWNVPWKLLPLQRPTTNR